MTYHNTPEDMTKTLVTYIACDEAVQREVASTFISAPPLSTIKQIRVSYEYQRKLAKAWADSPVDRAQTKRDDRYAAGMEKASHLFAQRLVAEGWHV